MIQLVLDSDTIKTGGGVNSKTARLGVEGQKVLDDTKEVLRSLKAWGEEKNGDDLLQNFFVSCQALRHAKLYADFSTTPHPLMSTSTSTHPTLHPRRRCPRTLNAPSLPSDPSPR